MDIKIMSEENKLWEVVSGSRAYGTQLPTSDEDIRGIFAAPLKYLINPFENIEQYMGNGDTDFQYYELTKFMRLLADNNPNIIEVLFVPEECVKFKDRRMDVLLKNRQLLLSKKVKYTFSGYAISQLKRIRGHYKWINNPQPETPPALWDYVRVTDETGIELDQTKSKEHLKFFTPSELTKSNFKLWKIASNTFSVGLLKDEGQTVPSSIDISLERLKEFKAEYKGMAVINWEAYKTDMKRWNDFWSWKKNRNETRALLETQYGLDTKHAMHLVRLLRMGKEILSEGVVHVRRPDAQELLSIRNGAWAYDRIIEYAEELINEVDALYEKSTLPEEVDKNLVADIFFEMVLGKA